MASCSDLAESFQCPICRDYATKPIYSCVNGHMVCHNCKPMLTPNRCPLCRELLERNRGLEFVASRLAFPCKFAEDGCKVTCSVRAKELHEFKCPFISMRCPTFEACQWEGKLGEMPRHIREKHEKIEEFTGESILHNFAKIFAVGPPVKANFVTVQRCFGQVFLLILEEHDESGKRKFSLSLRLIGSRRDARHFDYRAELKYRKHSLTWQGGVRSLLDASDLDLVKDECLEFSDQTALKFVDKVGHLNIAITIIKILELEVAAVEEQPAAVKNDNNETETSETT